MLLLGAMVRGAAVCGVCLCLPTFSSHASGSFERALLSESRSRQLWMTATPTLSPSTFYWSVCGNFSATATSFLCTLSTYTQSNLQMLAQFFQPLTSCPFPSKTSLSAYARGYPTCHGSLFCSFCVSIYNPVFSLTAKKRVTRTQFNITSHHWSSMMRPLLATKSASVCCVPAPADCISFAKAP